MAYARVLVALPVLALCACSKSVAYYRDHPQERGSKLDGCIGEQSTDCQNLRQAEYEARGVRAKDGVPVH